MNPVEMAQALQALTAIANILNRLGVPGLVALALIGPALVLCAVVGVEYLRGRRVQDAVETVRAENRALIEMYRADTQEILRVLGENQRRTDQYYRDNVELVKGCNRVADNLQDVVILNTRALERINTILEERRHI